MSLDKSFKFFFYLTEIENIQFQYYRNITFEQ